MKLRCGLYLVIIEIAAIVSIQPGAVALTADEVDQIARKVTIQIDSQTPGSGVIIQRQGNTYTVLTAGHVVKTEDT